MSCASVHVERESESGKSVKSVRVKKLFMQCIMIVSMTVPWYMLIACLRQVVDASHVAPEHRLG